MFDTSTTLPNLSDTFPSYGRFEPHVPVWCVTPHAGRTIHRFFDTSPFSPSGRLLGLTRLPFEDRLPSPGEAAEIVLVDLTTGKESVVAESRAWDTQLGAQVQWGQSDAELLFNDLDIGCWRPFGVVLDPSTGERRTLQGSLYAVSSNGKLAASPCLLRMGRTQPGYGVIAPDSKIPVNRDAPDDDGIYLTDIVSGQERLLVSLRTIVDSAIGSAERDKYHDGDFYCFHVKWNPRGDRIMLVLRWRPRRAGAPTRSQVITMKADGSEIHTAVTAEQWDKGGHHPNWCADGETIIMNLVVDGETGSSRSAWSPAGLRDRLLHKQAPSAKPMRFIRARYDGGYELLSHTLYGSGHPTMHPDGRHLVTDAYPDEVVAFGDGTVPIRLIDLLHDDEQTLIRIGTRPAYAGPRGELRIDPHPAWDREYRRLAFNASIDGTRRVFVADLTNMLVETTAASWAAERGPIG